MITNNVLLLTLLSTFLLTTSSYCVHNILNANSFNNGVVTEIKKINETLFGEWVKL